MSAQAGGFGRKFLSGSLWIMLRLLGRQAIQSLAFFAFAYFMTPASFGLAAMATSLGFLGRLVVERGAMDRVIQREAHDQSSLSTTFWLAMALGLVMTILLAAIGWLIVRVSPELSDVAPFIVASIVPLLVAPSRVHEGLIRREFGFRRLAALQMSVSVLSLVVSLSLVWLGTGPWAVIAFVLSEAAFMSIALLIISPWQPDFAFDAAEARDQLRFSGAVVLGAVLTVGNLRIVEIVLGMMLGPAAAGFFRLGVQVNRLLTQMLRTPVNNMVLPSFARLSDPTVIASRLLDVSALSGLVSLPAFVLAAAGSPDLFELVMGPEWRPAGMAAHWICMGIYAQLLPPIVNPVLISMGRPFDATRLAAVVFAASLALSVLGASLFGLSGATLGLTAVVVVLLPYTVHLIQRHFGLTVANIRQALIVPFAASLASYMFTTGILLLGEEPASGLQLTLALAAGGLFYLVLAWMGLKRLDPDRMALAQQKLIQFRKRKGGPA